MNASDELYADAMILMARDARAKFMRDALRGFAQKVFGNLPESMRRARLRRKTLKELHKLDARTLYDIGLTPANLRMAAFAAADRVFDQDATEKTTGSFMTQAKTVGFSATGSQPEAEKVAKAA